MLTLIYVQTLEVLSFSLAYFALISVNRMFIKLVKKRSVSTAVITRGKALKTYSADDADMFK
jgi:hypothetical protein